MSFFKALRIKLVTCLDQIVLCTFSAAGQSVLPRFIFRCARIKPLYIDNGIASYRISYKEYIDILYKLDIPPSPNFNVIIFFNHTICI